MWNRQIGSKLLTGGSVENNDAPGISISIKLHRQPVRRGGSHACTIDLGEQSVGAAWIIVTPVLYQTTRFFIH